ncbi:hypothetical protein [Domibacillus indicus]|uniref:hypothetical protein n=1 Tax=Domibacillus indicus TaxID=1437523 RepID=UPI000617FE48|nr:hypothetical protein [Domibacillus indicus]
MKKKWLLAVLVILIAGASLFYLPRRYPTLEGALNELKAREEGDVILPLNDSRKALQIDKDGRVSIAYSRAVRPLDVYEKFDILPTGLTIYDIQQPGDLPYTVSPIGDSIRIGLVQSRDAVYTISGLKSNLDNREDAVRVFTLQDYRKGEAALQDIKLWWTPHPLDTESIQDHFFFLDSNKKIVDVDKSRAVEK